ncbi:MAG: hypothetical protein IJU31_01430 [Synergistaceae bacterium]|nr:hypothetical protein [Synergistaceae bacterium]
MTQNKRPRIDWDAEIQKTENIKRRGFLMSGLSFALACALIFGMSRATGSEIEIPRAVLVAVCFFVSCVVFGIVMKRRANRKNKPKNE